ncbi:unnamed protein product [Rhodiola kirilowii]
MGSAELARPHAVCVPFPAQGHVIPMMQLAKLLHSRGFYITFVNTEFNHRRLLRSKGADGLEGLPYFQFETVADGLPPSDKDATQDPPALCNAILNNMLEPFKELISSLNSSNCRPPVTCIVADGVMSFGIKAAEELGIPEFQLWTASACGFLGYLSFGELENRGIVPFKEGLISNEILDQRVDWIPSMPDIRLKDLPSILRTTDPEDVMFHYLKTEVRNCLKAPRILINTFDDLELNSLEELKKQHPCIYQIGPLLQLADRYVLDTYLKSFNSSLWKADATCLDWLSTKEPRSVVYVNYGSVTTMSHKQLLEFAWGLASSEHSFLWVVRPDVLGDESVVLPKEFFEEVKDRGLVVSWCGQEQVLNHSSVGTFLTHCGWNSMLESISAGIPLICWPNYSEQHTNSRYACTDWGIGLELGCDADRGEIKGVIKEMMEEEKGKELRENAKKLKRKAEATIEVGGSSYNDFLKFISEGVIHP